MSAQSAFERVPRELRLQMFSDVLVFEHALRRPHASDTE